jgi:recombinational DNA repair ATPase RecF
MAFIRKLVNEHFRGIECLRWIPYPRINYLVGPADNGKSTILDAIERCLSASGQLQFQMLNSIVTSQMYQYGSPLFSAV